MIWSAGFLSIACPITRPCGAASRRSSRQPTQRTTLLWLPRRPSQRVHWRKRHQASCSGWKNKCRTPVAKVTDEEGAHVVKPRNWTPESGDVRFAFVHSVFFTKNATNAKLARGAVFPFVAYPITRLCGAAWKRRRQHLRTRVALTFWRNCLRASRLNCEERRSRGCRGGRANEFS